MCIILYMIYVYNIYIYIYVIYVYNMFILSVYPLGQRLIHGSVDAGNHPKELRGRWQVLRSRAYRSLVELERFF